MQRREFSCLETFNVIAQERILFVFFCYESQSISSPQNPGPNRFSGLQSMLSFQKARQMVDCSRTAQSLNKLADYKGEASKIVV